MNCIDVHRKLTADPSIQDNQITAHLEQCSACANFLQNLKQFDNALHKATNIDIPDGLAERILLKQSFKQQRQQRNTRFKLYAMVASLLLVLGIGFNMSQLSTLLAPSLSPGDVAINHVSSEFDHLNENHNIQLAGLNKVLQPFNIKFKHTIGTINYAGSCPIRHSRGVHIVLKEHNTTATLLLMPGEYIKSRNVLTKGNFTTTIVPAKNGSIAIVTDKNIQPGFAQKLEKQLNETIQFI